MTAPDPVTTPTEDRAPGLEDRYTVTKVKDSEGRHDDCRYFVLDPQHDPLARDALRAYSKRARSTGFFTLADDLDQWLRDIEEDS